jgi:hypothetical protein
MAATAEALPSDFVVGVDHTVFRVIPSVNGTGPNVLRTTPICTNFILESQPVENVLQYSITQDCL